jgi:hypothetical protein
MIVVDENIHDHRIIDAISAWYRGRVVSITTLRPSTVIHDDAIPTLLLQARQSTFVTINVSDFWPRVQSHDGFCIITVVLPQERGREVPDILRRLFRLPEFKTKASRLGKIVRVTASQIEYYESDWGIHSLAWLD